jgi:predicted dehydrogenase/threonine dehydrogenase-like Zn-dependent dehydrogenase
MLQIFQNLKSGETQIEEVPVPACSRGSLLIRTRRTLISAGTERMLVEFSKGNLLAKARSQPDRVKQVLDKIKTDGLLPTLETVFNKLDEPLPLGYCNTGEILETGSGVEEFKPGDRVVSNGPHAEIIVVPKNLCAKIPDNVSDDSAAFTVIASIGLQGIRLLQPTLGEKIVVFGTGLIGLIVIQLLRASGCEVLAVDINESRLQTAEEFDAKICNSKESNPVITATNWTTNRGVDGVIITASSHSNDIIHQSAEMCRKRGRIILVGAVGLNLKRDDFYKKELSFQVSCSYGAGRYDEEYEQNGNDYPIGYVRWTEQRNFEAVLSTLQSGTLQVEKLITHRVPIATADTAYTALLNDPKNLGTIIEYPNNTNRQQTVQIHKSFHYSQGTPQAVVALVGAGNFSKAVIAPCLAKTNARLKYVVGHSKPGDACHLAKRNKFEQVTTDFDTVLNDPEVNTVIIATGHDSHAALVCKALESEKHVFVEKPLAINRTQLDNVQKIKEKLEHLQLMVGFNRRFSIYTTKIKELLKGRSEPLAMNFMVNAGMIPHDHSVHKTDVGGGRMIGEGCHFIDMLRFITDSRIIRVSAEMLGKGTTIKDDKMSVQLAFEDGSVGTINYFANGNKSFPKELLTIYSEGRILTLNNFRSLLGYGFPKFKRFKTFSQDKGHQTELKMFITKVIDGGLPLIPLQELVNVTYSSFAAVISSTENRFVFEQELI